MPVWRRRGQGVRRPATDARRRRPRHRDLGPLRRPGPRRGVARQPIPAGALLPGIPGSLNLRHPEACAALAKQAASEGTQVLQGVADVTVTPGRVLQVSATGPGGQQVEFRPRLVIGADGRHSTVRRQSGITLLRHEATHMIAGVLVDGLADLDLQHDWLATSDDLFMASFRQRHGQVRLYLVTGMAEKSRFAGHGGLAEFMRSANFGCLPFGERLATANPIGPLATYPGDDTVAARPFVDGVVLIGDAAGHNSPITGQGLSIALRDARSIRDAIRSGDDLTAAFASYAEERLERLRRLRTNAIVTAAMAADDCDNSIARRAKFFELLQTDPMTFAMLVTMFTGPETAPPEAYDDRLLETIVAA
ncbi:MAG: FAD-dependent oxidoreductase [Acidimicrobiales bacterium]